MAQSKRKVVFNAEAEQLERVEALVRAGRFRTTSEFLREAIDDKLEALRRALLEDEVARYCAEGHADEDSGLIGAQAFDED